METKYIKKKLTIDDVQVRSYGFVKDAMDNYGTFPGAFDPNAIDEASVDIVQQIRDQIDAYKKKYKEDIELYCICEMAIEYLKLKEKEKSKSKENDISNWESVDSDPFCGTGW